MLKATLIRTWRESPTTTKLLASVAVLAACAAIAGLGTYATFTSSATAAHTVSSGTVTISFGGVNRLTVGASNVAAGDTIQRAFDLSDSGSIDLASFTFSSSA